LQTGTVVERSDGFYIRYYKDGDGGERTKVTERLCDLTVLDPRKRKLLARSHMSAINNAHHMALCAPRSQSRNAGLHQRWVLWGYSVELCHTKRKACCLKPSPFWRGHGLKMAQVG